MSTSTTSQRRRLPVALTVLFGLAAAPALAADTVVIGTSSPGGSYFLMGGALATAVNERTDAIVVTARTTGGSVENMRLLATNQIDVGMSNAAAVYNAVRAAGPFEGQPAVTNARGVATIEISPLHWVTRVASGITSFDDFGGKRVSVGAAGSGTAANAELSLEILGLLDSIRPQFLGFNESADSMRDGNTDVFAASSSVPMPAVSGLASTQRIRLIGYTEEQMAAHLEANPAYMAYTIPGGSYDGFDEPVLTFGVPSTIVVRDDVPDDVVYAFVMLMMREDTAAYMRTAYKTWDPSPAVELFEQIGVPLHPGAERAYRELGLL